MHATPCRHHRGNMRVWLALRTWAVRLPDRRRPARPRSSLTPCGTCRPVCIAVMAVVFHRAPALRNPAECLPLNQAGLSLLRARSGSRAEPRVASAGPTSILSWCKRPSGRAAQRCGPIAARDRRRVVVCLLSPETHSRRASGPPRSILSSADDAMDQFIEPDRAAAINASMLIGSKPLPGGRHRHWI
jgi:hypothetical protein